eukprot:scaffold6767_cov223-Isochrysis_galbana.AAC.14
MLMRLVYCLASLVCVILCGLRSGQDAMRAMRHATPRPLILHYRLRSLLVALGAVLLCSRWGGGEAASVRTSRVEHPAPVCCGSRGVIRLVRPLALLRRRPPLHTREDPVQRVGQSGVGASLGQLTHHLPGGRWGGAVGWGMGKNCTRRTWDISFKLLPECVESGGRMGCGASGG